MPKPDLEVPTPANAIGYGCVIVKDLDEYQGFFITDDETTMRQARTAMMMAMASGTQPTGALQAVVVDGVLNRKWDQVGIAALALTSSTGMEFFVIHASMEPEGIRTEMKELKATTVEEARDEINALPEIVDLKARLVEKLKGPKH